MLYQVDLICRGCGTLNMVTVNVPNDARDEQAARFTVACHRCTVEYDVDSTVRLIKEADRLHRDTGR